MNFNDVAKGLTPEVYEQLKSAVEIGKWPDGRVLSKEQRQISMEAVLRYEVENLAPEQRTGYIPPKTGDACSHDDVTNSDRHANEPQAIRWRK